MPHHGPRTHTPVTPPSFARTALAVAVIAVFAALLMRSGAIESLNASGLLGSGK